MPTYEYKCPKGHLFEKFYPAITSKRTATCPRCGKKAERQLSGGGGLVFKGSGFYITDYKRAGEKKEGESKPAEKPAEKKPEAKPESKSESKSKKDSPKK
ncbi:MAG TPA: FmdB family zinc ribbon protein [Gemmatimonadales bacterium]|nr:FmdB family zinc ribbon protein [Gemmatimonadales bacterium]